MNVDSNILNPFGSISIIVMLLALVQTGILIYLIIVGINFLKVATEAVNIYISKNKAE